MLIQNKLLKDLIDWKIPESKSFEYRTPDKPYPFKIDQIYNSAQNQTLKYSPLKGYNTLSTTRTPLITKAKIIEQNYVAPNSMLRNESKFIVDFKNSRNSRNLNEYIISENNRIVDFDARKYKPTNANISKIMDVNFYNVYNGYM